ncbi:unnamed protein product [Rhizophagus irregularis]|nr:unnamed protein product [Rhizophagus irregularis]
MSSTCISYVSNQFHKQRRFTQRIIKRKRNGFRLGQKYQCANGHYFKNNGGLVISLILAFNVYNTYSTYRYDVRSLMTDSIYLGYVDMINLLIERYAVGGNTFSTFDVKEPEEETPIKSQEKSWKIHYDPSYSNKFVEPPYLFYAAYYGNIATAKFDYNECIKALLEGADPGITDCNGWSLAHYVVYV